MKLVKSYSDYTITKYCKSCGWYHDYYDTVDKSMLCCPKCGEDAEMVRGRYMFERNDPTNCFEDLQYAFMLDKFCRKIVGFELKKSNFKILKYTDRVRNLEIPCRDS